MRRQFRMTAIALIFSILIPFTTFGQEAPPPPPVLAPKPSPGSTSSPQAAPKKPLSVNENPEMIGKRNINKGIWGKMASGSEKEIALGRQLAAQFEKEAKLVVDPIMTEYVNRVGQNIVIHSDAKIPFTIKIVDSDEANAFALPGGFFYVNRGLILMADNEAELAGVMAHEIAHVAARHAMENSKKMEMIDYGILAGILLGGGIPSTVLRNGGGILEQMIHLKFTRGSEEEADKLGAQYLWAAGYDPNALATMFEKLEAKNKKKPGTVARLFATHPTPPNRRAHVIDLVARFPERDEYVISSSEFQRIKAKLLSMSAVPIQTVDSNSVSGPDASTGPVKPTMKRRQPPPPDEKPENTEESKPREKPTLKKPDKP